MARTVRLAAATLTALVAGGMIGLPADAATGGAERDTVRSGDCSGTADYRLRIWRTDGSRHFRVRVVNAAASSHWDVSWSYDLGQSGSGEDDSATAAADGTWSDSFTNGDTSRHFSITMRATRGTGQVCRAFYQQ